MITKTDDEPFCVLKVAPKEATIFVLIAQLAPRVEMPGWLLSEFHRKSNDLELTLDKDAPSSVAGDQRHRALRQLRGLQIWSSDRRYKRGEQVAINGIASKHLAMALAVVPCETATIRSKASGGFGVVAGYTAPAQAQAARRQPLRRSLADAGRDIAARGLS